MPQLRWLVPIVTALVLVGQSLTAWAAAGTFGEPACCCPKARPCKCPGHGDAPPSSELRRCGGDAERVAPAPLVAEPPPPAAPAGEPRVARPPPPPPLPRPSAHLAEPPEPPPF